MSPRHPLVALKILLHRFDGVILRRLITHRNLIFSVFFAVKDRLDKKHGIPTVQYLVFFIFFSLPSLIARSSGSYVN